MKKSFHRALAIGVMAVMLVTTAVAASTTTKKMIEANYSGIKLVVDGVEVTPKDANGKVVEPFISEGTTYLPVRSVGEALGKEVKWDGSTKTVYIGKVPGTADNWMKKLPPYQLGLNCGTYDGSDPTAGFSVGGVLQTAGVRLSSNGMDGGTYAIWNTNGEYKTMTFKFGSLDGNTNDMTFTVYLDGEVYEKIDMEWSKPAQTITIPLNYAANIRIASPSSSCRYGIYDISFS